jgi:hypothetical protein
MDLSRLSRLMVFCVLILVGYSLVGCGTPSTPTPSPTATLAPTEGKIIGLLIQSGTRTPVSSALQLLAYEKDTSGNIKWVFTSQCTTTGSSGSFEFKNVKPGQYAMDMWKACNVISPQRHFITDQNGQTVIFTVEGGRVLDAGEIAVKYSSTSGN